MGTWSFGMGMGGMAGPILSPAARRMAPMTARATAGMPGIPAQRAPWPAQLPGPRKSTLPRHALSETCKSREGALTQAPASLKASSSGPESLPITRPQALQAQQRASRSGRPCARKWTESTESFFFSSEAWYCAGVISGLSKALPSGEGFDLATMSAVGAMILGNEGGVLAKNIVRFGRG